MPPSTPELLHSGMEAALYKVSVVDLVMDNACGPKILTVGIIRSTTLTVAKFWPHDAKILHKIATNV